LWLQLPPCDRLVQVQDRAGDGGPRGQFRDIQVPGYRRFADADQPYGGGPVGRIPGAAAVVEPAQDGRLLRSGGTGQGTPVGELEPILESGSAVPDDPLG